jgi:hypothetical protein
MSQDATTVYPLGAGMVSGVTAGGFSPLAAMGFPTAAATPTTRAAGLTGFSSSNFSMGGLAYVGWVMAFLVGGLVLLHIGAERG